MVLSQRGFPPFLHRNLPLRDIFPESTPAPLSCRGPGESDVPVRFFATGLSEGISRRSAAPTRQRGWEGKIVNMIDGLAFQTETSPDEWSWKIRRGEDHERAGDGAGEWFGEWFDPRSRLPRTEVVHQHTDIFVLRIIFRCKKQVEQTTHVPKKTNNLPTWLMRTFPGDLSSHQVSDHSSVDPPSPAHSDIFSGAARKIETAQAHCTIRAHERRRRVSKLQPKWQHTGMLTRTYSNQKF